MVNNPPVSSSPLVHSGWSRTSQSLQIPRSKLCTNEKLSFYNNSGGEISCCNVSALMSAEKILLWKSHLAYSSNQSATVAFSHPPWSCGPKDEYCIPIKVNDRCTYCRPLKINGVYQRKCVVVLNAFSLAGMRIEKITWKRFLSYSHCANWGGSIKARCRFGQVVKKDDPRWKALHLQSLRQVPMVKSHCRDNVVCKQLIWEESGKKILGDSSTPPMRLR